MDPATLANAEWTDIGKLLTYLWIVVGLIVVFATNMIIGHIFIPSLVASHHIPPYVERTRVLFYAAGAIALALALFLMVQVIGLSDVLARFYDSYFI